jgi:hypothetical protein
VAESNPEKFTYLTTSLAKPQNNVIQATETSGALPYMILNSEDQPPLFTSTKQI